MKEKTKKLYVSLPISGYNLDVRKNVAYGIKEKLTEQGYEVVTPFDVCPDPTLPYSSLMGKCVEALLQCDYIYFCAGWLNSKGCKAEHAIAKIYGIEKI